MPNNEVTLVKAGDWNGKTWKFQNRSLFVLWGNGIMNLVIFVQYVEWADGEVFKRKQKKMPWE